jgi:hypothetical protein
LDVNDSEQNVRAKIVDNGHSRFLVCEDTLDNCLGYVRTRAIVDRLLDQAPLDLRAMIREPLRVVPELKTLTLMAMFRRSRPHLAVIADEYGTILGVATPVTLQNLFGWINAPFAWLIGVPSKDCVTVGQIMGERIVLNEFIGYLSLSEHAAKLDSRSFVLATYALCGFANFSSIAIQIGGIGALAPTRRADLAQLGLRAMVAGTLANFLTATIAGMLL